CEPILFTYKSAVESTVLSKNERYPGKGKPFCCYRKILSGKEMYVNKIVILQIRNHLKDEQRVIDRSLSQTENATAALFFQFFIKRIFITVQQKHVGFNACFMVKRQGFDNQFFGTAG